ncbi:MAG: rod shape-determining protein MreD [Gammaproteobacteria bacterium]|nr:rod shape-determining protein MreD [Gammaproteobacteria bacterium]MBQ0838455.1 rod shape-determining protein MreD [Gammaproteobacteria bacterium]
MPRGNSPLPLTAMGLSLIAALFLYSLPLHGGLAFWRPPFVLLVTIYWLIVQPQHLGITFVWLIGLLLDLLYGNVIGQNALAMSVTAYLLKTQQYHVRHLSLPFQCLAALFIVMIYQTLWVSTRLISEDIVLGWRVFYPALSSALIWPLLAGSLYKLQRLFS